MDIQHTPSHLSIHEAAEQGNLKHVKFLLENGKARVTDTDDSPLNRTVLHYAARGGQIEMVKFLLSKGAKIEEKDTRGYNSLEHAIIYGHLNITRLFLAQGIEVNKEPYLHEAAREGHGEIIKQLLRHGANANADAHDFPIMNTTEFSITKFEGTALHEAVQLNQTLSILLLYPLTHAAVKNKHGKMPMELLIGYFEHNIETRNQIELEKNIQCLYAFLLCGANINEELVSKTIAKKEQFLQVMCIIQEAISTFDKEKKQIEIRLGYQETSRFLSKIIFWNLFWRPLYSQKTKEPVESALPTTLTTAPQEIMMKGLEKIAALFNRTLEPQRTQPSDTTLSKK
jgi:hypothetical protein